MKNGWLIVPITAFVLLAGCGGETASKAPLSEDEVQETVQDYYNEMSKLEQDGKAALENFNKAIADFSAGKVTDKEMEKAIDEFKDSTADLTKQARKVKVSGRLPENIRKLLEESQTAFQDAYSLKEKASQGADSTEVSPEEFNEINQNADLAMLFGISKLNEARMAAGLIESEGKPSAGQK